MDEPNEERIIFAVKHYAKQQPGLGLIRPIAELLDGQLTPLTPETFCPTGSVFITSRYEELDAKFGVGEVFKIPVTLNHQVSDKASNPSKYVSQGNRAEKPSQSELAEVIAADLPDRNDRRLFLDNLPTTPYIFVSTDSGDCFGPLDWDATSSNDGQTSEISLKFITGGGLGQAGGNKLIHQIARDTTEARVASVDIDGRVRRFVSNVAGFTNGAPYFDYASDKEIVEYVRIIAGDAGSRIVDRQKFQSLAGLASKNPKNNNMLAKNRLSRFSKLVDENTELHSLVQGELDEYLKGESGRKTLEDYVQRNKARYIDQLKKDREIELDALLSRKQDEIRQADNRQALMRDQLTKLNDEIERQQRITEQDVKANQAAILEKTSEETAARMREGQRQYDEIEVRVQRLRELYGAYENVELIENKIKDERTSLRLIQEMANEERRQLTGLKQEIAKEEDELRKKLRDLKPYVEHINGSFFAGDLEVPNVCVETNGAASQAEKPALQRSVIEAVQTNLLAQGRSLTEWEVANLLICTQQSFITFFAGLPGVGKTSLSRLLASVQGLDPRMHEVSVARGWTSLKDMVGFHNPLSDRFQPANTGLYQYLLSLEKELFEGRTSAMSYVLLDEANLSPIEHYWSSFMALTDGGGERSLRVGQRVLRIPAHLRFLATINYDGTTEPLSPRVVDRAPVLVMNPDTIADRVDSATEERLRLPLTEVQMSELFGTVLETPGFELDEETAFDDIYDTLSSPVLEMGRPISISQRKIGAIRQYCGKARSVMRPVGGALMALDLAVLQHVLPQVRGHGQKFAKRLDALRKKLNEHELNRSTDYLAQMIAYGEADLHSYDFFCW